jgi:hypothetical protein
VTPNELVKLFRREIDDLTTPYLWSEDDVYHYLDLAQREFAKLTLIFADSTTAEVCSAAVLADEKFVDLSPLIIQIRQAKLLSATRKLHLTSLDKISQGFGTDDYGMFSDSAWETSTGAPRALMLDVEIDKGRLVPIPTEDDTLELMVYRYPLNVVTSSSAELEVTRPEHQRHLLLKMKSLAYGKHDSDVHNDTLEEKYQIAFESACGTVHWELKRMRDKNWTTRSAWL